MSRALFFTRYFFQHFFLFFARRACNLLQVPNQAIHFKAEQPPRGRSEDAIIAYTWNHFLNDPSQPEWLLRLPMTKVKFHIYSLISGCGARHGLHDRVYGQDLWHSHTLLHRGWRVQARLDHVDHRRRRQARHRHCPYRHG
jgi:hypothetical protein